MTNNKRPENMIRITNEELAKAFIDEQIKAIKEQAVFILGDRGVKQLVKANRRHVFNPPFRNVSPHLWRNGESRCRPHGRYTGGQ